MNVHSFIFLSGFLFIFQFFLPGQVSGRIILDINAPSIPRIKIAIPDFKNNSSEKRHTELAAQLPEILSNDLALSGYFTPMDKEAFLENDASPNLDSIQFRDWSVIGAELLLKAGYTTIGRSLEVEFRLYDVYRGRLLLGRRFLGKIEEQRQLMHRVGNEILRLLTGYRGMFLSRIAFVGNGTGHKEIYMADFDGHNVEGITSDRSIALFPKWSPKGDKLIYNSYRDGGPRLYLKDLKSGRVKGLSARKGLNIGASWAPDGGSLALTLSHGENPDIYRIDLEGKIIKRLINHWGIDVSPSFSPDGSKIAFVSDRSGSPQIYVWDLSEEKGERVSFEGKYNTSPAWSSLNRIAFAGGDEGQRDIYTINPDGGGLRKLTQDQRNNEDPCWSPDGRYLMFSSNRDGRYSLYLMNANGQNQRRITNMKGDQTSPSWSPF
ncbi:MAG: Tol-Pal system beta propeller repeat protein TolB [Pseudomonadota bacterium]